MAGIAVTTMLGAAVVAVARSTGWLESLGGRMSGARLDRARRSPQWVDGRFENPMATRTVTGSLFAMLRMQVCGKQVRYSPHPIPVETRKRVDYDPPPESGLRVVEPSRMTDSPLEPWWRERL